jgi:tRNA(Ile)-lysidine synthase
MLDEFLKYIQENNLIRKNARVLLAVSGGIDSMVMAHLFINTGINAGIAHCNFCLRGEESDLDEALVKEFAEENKIPFYSRRFATKDYAKNNGISIQMAAREMRYEWFEAVRKENKFDCIAIAHNLNDNIETLLINLIRGTGISGLTGMKSKSKRIIRPLLFATREKITEYCTTRNISFRDDKSNSETKYTRNKIRHLVIPLLREINPSIEETLNQTATRLSGINEIVSAYTEGIRKLVSVKKGKATIFYIDKLKELKSGEAVIFELFRPFGIADTTSENLIKIMDGRSGSQVFTPTHRIIKNRNELLVYRFETPANRYFVINNIENLSNTPHVVSVAVITELTGFKIPDDPYIGCFDYEKVRFPLIIRKWERGDYFYPLGMKQRKKLSDYFIDRKFSLIKKEKALILESAGKIIWIIGERIDESSKVKGSTTKILKIQAARD